jgi:hypothetical protein
MIAFVHHAQEPGSVELRAVPVHEIGKDLEQRPKIGRILARGVAQ